MKPVHNSSEKKAAFHQIAISISCKKSQGEHKKSRLLPVPLLAPGVLPLKNGNTIKCHGKVVLTFTQYSSIKTRKYLGTNFCLYNCLKIPITYLLYFTKHVFFDYCKIINHYDFFLDRSLGLRQSKAPIVYLILGRSQSRISIETFL